MNKYQKIFMSDVLNNEVSLSNVINKYNELVELHIPKKLDHSGYGASCPHCLNLINTSSWLFCPSCGQTLDWSDDNANK